MFDNGQDALNHISDVLSNIYRDFHIQPISLLLLDINMPIINGLECAQQVKQLYREINEKLAKEQGIF